MEARENNQGAVLGDGPGAKGLSQGRQNANADAILNRLLDAKNSTAQV